MDRVNIGRLLLTAFEAFQDRLVGAIRDAGFPDIRITDTSVLRNLDPDGTRITDLAERAHVTKQAMSQLVRSLEDRGYVSRGPDPEDGRALRVRLTSRGLRLTEAADGALRDIEERWGESLGPERYRNLRGLLAELLRSEEALPPFQDPLDWYRDEEG